MYYDLYRTLRPIFSGQTEDDKRVILYQDNASEEKYLGFDLGPIRPLPSGTELSLSYEQGLNLFRLVCKTPPLAGLWSGVAEGYRETLEAEQYVKWDPAHHAIREFPVGLDDD